MQGKKVFYEISPPPPPIHAALHEDINSGPKSREEHETIVVCAKHLMYVL